MPAFNKAFFTFADSVYDTFHKANLSNEDIGKVIAQGLDKDGYKLNVGKYSQDSEYVIPNLGNIDYLLIIGTTKLSDTYKALREVYAANEGVVPIFSQSWSILGNEAYLNGTEAFNYVNNTIRSKFIEGLNGVRAGVEGGTLTYLDNLSIINNARFVQGGPGTGKTSVIDNLTKQLHDKLHPNANYIAVAPHQIQVDNLKSLLKIKEDQCYTLDELFKIILDGEPELNTGTYHGAQYKQESIKFNKDVVSKLKLNKNTIFFIDEGTFASEGKLQVLSKLGDVFGTKYIISGDRKQNGEFALDPDSKPGAKTYSSTGVEDCIISTAMELTSTIRAENVAQLNNVIALGEKVDRGFSFYRENRDANGDIISEKVGTEPVELEYSEGDDFFVGTKTIGSITDAKAYVNKFKKLAGDKTILIISDHKDDYKDLQGDKQILVLDAHAAQGGEFDYVVVDKRFEGNRYDQFRDINTILSRAKIGSVIVNKPEIKSLINTNPKDKSLATEPTTISSSIDQLTAWEKQNHDFLGEVKTSKSEKEEKPKKDNGKINPDGLTETQVQILDVLSSDFEDEGTQDEVITTVAAD